MSTLFLNPTTARPLVSQTSTSTTLRFNPYILKPNQNLMIAVQILEIYQKKYWDQNIVHGNLVADHILIKKNVSHQNSDDYQIEIIPSDPSRPSNLLPKDKFHDCLTLLFTLKEGLHIQHPLALVYLYQFISNQHPNNTSITDLITQLKSCVDQPISNLDFLKNVDIPIAQAGKDTILFSVQNISDGVGDFTHAWDLARALKALLHEKKYRLVVFVEGVNLPSGIENEIRNKLYNKEETPFDDFMLYLPKKYDDKEYKKAFDSENADKINELSQRTIGAFEVSHDCPIDNIIKTKRIYSIRIMEYGYPKSNTYGGAIYDRPMGIQANNRMISGIKFNEFPYESLEQRAQRLIALQSHERDFLCALLSTNSPTLEQARQYLVNNHFMPAFLQSKNESWGMLLIHALKYDGDNKTCDFLLPPNIIDKKIIVRLLAKIGIPKEEVLFFIRKEGQLIVIDADDNPIPQNKQSRNPKVRIFGLRINDDKSYTDLYRVSDDGAGCSGNSSMSLVFSTQHVPFYSGKSPATVLTDFMTQVAAYAEECLKDAIAIHDDTLKNGLEALCEYLKLITDFTMSTEQTGAYDKVRKDREGKTIIIEGTYEGLLDKCRTIARLLKNPNLTIAWRYVADKMKAMHNVYDSLTDMVKLSVLSNLNHMRELHQWAVLMPQIQAGKLLGLYNPGSLDSKDINFLMKVNHIPLINGLIEAAKASSAEDKRPPSAILSRQRTSLPEAKRKELLPSLLEFCKNLPNKPAKISRRELPSLFLTSSLFDSIGFSLFVDSSGHPYALYEGKALAFKRDTDKGKVTAQVKMGEDLITGEPVVLKIETLPTDSDARSVWKKIIDNESELAIKAGLALSDGYVGQKHYQVSHLRKGAPLPEPLSSLTALKRFDVGALTPSEKIDIAMLIIEKLYALHFKHHIIHRDLYGDNILVSKEKNGEFQVEFVDYGLSAPLDPKTLRYLGPTGDEVWSDIDMLKKGKIPAKNTNPILQSPFVDIERVTESILNGLKIEDTVIKGYIKDFVTQNRSNVTPESYLQCISNFKDQKNQLIHAAAKMNK